MIGKVPPSTICRVPMRQYSLSGDDIRQSSPGWAQDRPEWVSKVKLNTRLYVMDSDAFRLDSSVRESLVILSNLDAVTSALHNTITDTDALTVPFIIRALQYIGGGLGDLARLATFSAHQLSLHRRDAALWEAKSRRISFRQLATLRHAPFLASQYVFEPETLQRISDERQEDAQKRAIMRLATTPLQSPRAQKQTTVKRYSSLPSTPQSASKKYRKQESTELLHGWRPPLRRGPPPSRIGDYCVEYREGCLRMLPLGTPLDTSLKELENVGMRGSSSVNLPVGGRLRHFWPVWHRMEANRRVVRWLKFGFPLRFDQSYVTQKGFPPLSLHPHDSLIACYRDQLKQSVLSEMLTLLILKQCITVMSEGEVGFFSRVFLVPKKSGGFRLVIDFSALNEWLAPVTFTMDTLKVVKETVQEGMWATFLDLSDAYHYIPIHPQYQKYLCFQVGDLKFRYLVLPFGLCRIRGRQVGYHTNAIHSVPRRQVESPPQPILYHSRAEAGHPIEHRSCDPARRPPILQSGVTTRSTGLRISDSSIRSPPSSQPTNKSNSTLSFYLDRVKMVSHPTSPRFRL